MSLTMGTGPFGHAPAGVFNIQRQRRDVLFFDPFPRRIRGLLGDETIVDSRRTMLLHEHGQLPRCYFPEADVRTDLLEPSSHTSFSPAKGEAHYWTLHATDRTVENAAWSYPAPAPDAPPLAGYVAFYFAALDEWLEEDEEMIGHARDPYHRVDVVATSRHVQVSLAGTVLADSRRTRVLFETGLPNRWYFPRDDVRVELIPSDLQTVCAYKGYASYWSVRTNGELHENLAWTYREPRHDADRVAGHVCFFNERTSVVVDGEVEPRVPSPWSQKDWWKHVGDWEHRV